MKRHTAKQILHFFKFKDLNYDSTMKLQQDLTAVERLYELYMNCGEKRKEWYPSSTESSFFQ